MLIQSSLKESMNIDKNRTCQEASVGSNVASISRIRDTVARDLEQNVPIRNNRYHFKVYRGTFVGREAVDYLILAGYARTREEAVALGREVCEELNLFEHVCRDHEFKDAFLFYRFIDPSLRRNPKNRGFARRGSGDSSSRQGSAIDMNPTDDKVADWPIEKLTQIVTQLRNNLVTKDRKYRLKTYARCFVASQAVDFMVGSEIVDKRADAVKLGLRLQKELGAFHHVRYDHDFEDEYLFFQWKIEGNGKSASLGERVSSRSPQAVLDFWFGPLRQAADMNEENWRNRMSQWRIGIFISGESADENFLRYQKEWCNDLVDQKSLLDGWENEPYGALAKLLILDQFMRTIYRGTPVAFSKQSEIAAIVKNICKNGWDEKFYSVVERMWVYFPAGVVEDKDMQDLVIAKLTKWSADVVAMSSKENKDVNRRVSLNCLKVSIEHAEAVAWYGRFPHRNAVHNRPNTLAELKYLLSETRPRWTMSQPVDPEFQALHALIHQLSPGEDCNELSKSAIVRFDEYFDLDGELIPVLFRGGKKNITFEELYKHLRQSSKKSTLKKIHYSKRMIKTEQKICQIVYQDEITIWPPIFSETPPAVDVRKLNAFIGCPLLVARAQFSVSRSAILDFQSQTGFRPDPIARLFQRHIERISNAAAGREGSSAGFSAEAVLDKDHFRAVIGPMFTRNRDTTLNQLYDLVDTGHNKILDTSELYVAMIVLGSGSTQDKVNLTVSFFDTDGDNKLNGEDMKNLFEVCFLRCPAFVSSLFEEYGAGLLISDDSNEEEEGTAVTVSNIQTLQKAFDLGYKALEKIDTNKDGMIERDELRVWLQSKPVGDVSVKNPLEEAKKLFLQLFGLNDMLFLDGL